MTEEKNELQEEYDGLTKLKDKYIFLTREIETNKAYICFLFQKAKYDKDYYEKIKEIATLIAKYKYMLKCVDIHLFKPQIHIEESKQ